MCIRDSLLLSLDFEKEGYGKGSEVTATLAVKDLKNKPLISKNITYKVTAKGQEFISQKAVTDDQGKTRLIFSLPENLQTTDVVINALVPHNASTEAISRSVPVVLDTIDLQFFPESGNIIASTTNTIAFKAINEFGKPVDVSGDIVNQEGSVVTTFSSFHDGMGSFTLLPNNKETYYAQLKEPFVSKQPLPLPKVNQKGTRFSINVKEDHSILYLYSTEDKPLLLEVANASKVLLEKQILSSEHVISVNNNKFSSGINKFSIKDLSGNILAERLVFIHPDKSLCVDINLDKDIYQTREKVKLTITTTNSNGKPIPSNLSLAVADNKLLSFADDKQDHILSYLLLSSELKGKIHEPSFYFNPEEEKSLKALDYLMLTHGWRTYINSPTITEETISFFPEQHAIQTGTIKDKKGKPISANLLLMDRHGNTVMSFETEDDGTFAFKLTNQESVVLLAYRDDGKKVTIKSSDIINGRYAHHEDRQINTKNETETEVFDKNIKPLKDKIKEKASISTVSLNEDSESLEEIVVVGFSSRTRSELTGTIASISNDEISNVVSVDNMLQGVAAGVQVISANGTPGQTSFVRIRGIGSITSGNAPLFVVDGVPLSESDVNSLNSSQVKSVMVLKDNSATEIYGSRGSNGVVVISTLSGEYYYETVSYTHLTLPTSDLV